MSDHGYEAGRLNLPFVGISTFGKRPYVADWDAIEADVAILGAPFDFGTQWRPGARFGPRAVREASTLFSFGHAGAYDHEDDATYLASDVRSLIWVMPISSIRKRMKAMPILNLVCARFWPPARCQW